MPATSEPATPTATDATTDAGGLGAPRKLAGSSQLSDEQRAVVDAVVTMRGGEVALIHGGAGVGKSAVIASVKEALDARDSGANKVVLTALTGLAATNIGGVTLHSAMGLTNPSLIDACERAFCTGLVGPYLLARTKVVDDVRKRGRFRVIKGYTHLVVDEVSMMSPWLYDVVADIWMAAKGSTQRWCELRLLLVGDFPQLPPVVRSAPRGAPPPLLVDHAPFLQDVPPRLCFCLTHVFRQGDPAFAQLLNRVRLNAMTEADHAVLSARVGATLPVAKPTRLEARNEEADAINARELRALGGKERAYVLVTRRAERVAACKARKTRAYTVRPAGGGPSYDVYKWVCEKGRHAACDGACYEPAVSDPTPKERGTASYNVGAAKVMDTLVAALQQRAKTREFKVGAVVILLANLSRELPNGSVGTLVGFSRRYSDQLKAHAAEVEAYNAACLARELDEGGDADGSGGDAAEPPRPPQPPPKPSDAGLLDALVADKAEERVAYPDEELPIVEFTLRGGDKTTVTIPYVRYDATHPSDGKAWAWCMPLTLGWATTVHRAQGQSLPYLSANLSARVFAPGQAYVALSRVTSLEGLSLQEYSRAAVFCDARVKDFCSSDYAEYRTRALAAAAAKAASGGGDSDDEVGAVDFPSTVAVAAAPPLSGVKRDRPATAAPTSAAPPSKKPPPSALVYTGWTDDMASAF